MKEPVCNLFTFQGTMMRQKVVAVKDDGRSTNVISKHFVDKN